MSDDEQRSPMTVGQLLRALQGIPFDKPVDLEGCDCAGALGSVLDEPDRVFLLRTDHA